MLEPKLDEQCDLGAQWRPSEDDHSLGSPSDTPGTTGTTPLDETRHLVPPTPPPSSEGSLSDIWRVDRGEEEEEEKKTPTEEEQEGEEEVSHSVEADEVEEKNEKDEDYYTNPPASSSSSSFIIPELRLDRSFSADALSSTGTDEDDEDEDEDDDEDEDEEDSDDNYLEPTKRRSMVEAGSYEKHSGSGGLSVQNSLRRRTHSEGSLLQDPRTTCFTSDNAINRLEVTTASKGGWTLPSPKTLKKELTKNGGSMHQLCMLFSGRKVSCSSEKQYLLLLAYYY